MIFSFHSDEIDSDFFLILNCFFFIFNIYFYNLVYISIWMFSINELFQSSHMQCIIRQPFRIYLLPRGKTFQFFSYHLSKQRKLIHYGWVFYALQCLIHNIFFIEVGKSSGYFLFLDELLVDVISGNAHHGV